MDIETVLKFALAIAAGVLAFQFGRDMARRFSV